MQKKKKEKIDIKPMSDGGYGLFVNEHLDVLSPTRKILEEMKRDDYKTAS